MKTSTTLLALFATLLLFACGSSDEPADAPAEEATASPEWQLLDDSMLIAKIEPWPPTAGPATLSIEVTTDDFDQRFEGTLEYRVVESTHDFGGWEEMTDPRVGEYESVFYEAPLTLEPGSYAVEIRLRERGATDSTELTDWRIEVK